MWNIPTKYKLVEVVLNQFVKEENFNVLCLVSLSIISNLIQTTGINQITSYLIDSIQNKQSANSWFFYQCLIGIAIGFIITYFLYYYFQNQIVLKMRHWMRYKMMESIFVVNNELFSEINFTRLLSPIGRVADLLCSMIQDIAGYFLPNLFFVIISVLYFSYLNPMYGAVFLIGNIILSFYYSYIIEELLQKVNLYETELLSTDATMIDLLNNVDKIVYRGTIHKEMENFQDTTGRNIKKGLEYYNTSLFHVSVVIFIIWSIILMSLSYLIMLFYQKKINVIGFLTAFNIMILFREKMISVNEQIPGFVGSIGRFNACMTHFEHINKNAEFLTKTNNNESAETSFRTIRFENVTYRYHSGKIVFQDKSFQLDTQNHQIIGITGPSGCGKSTLMKLLIKMYPYESGKIYIDEELVENMDPLYIREQITYVNQNSKLFDKKVFDNMLYGCNDPEKCKYLLNKILEYPSIEKLYKNMDIYTKNAGLLGENLSGGQRQVINMIGGFISPSKILILDEPTNALDPTLKKEIINLIQDFKRYKQAIIIITHDKDLFPLFDMELKM